MTPTMRTWLGHRVATYIEQSSGPRAPAASLIESPDVPLEPDAPPLPEDPAVTAVGEAFGLSADERALLWLAASVSLSAEVGPALRAINADPLDEGTSLGLLCRLACPGPAADALLVRLQVDSPLLRHGLLSLRGDGAWARRDVGVPIEIIQALAGHPPRPSAALAGALREDAAPHPWARAAQERLTWALARMSSGQPLALVGTHGCGRQGALAAIVGRLLTVDVAVLADEPGWRARLDEAARLARMRKALLAVELGGAPAEAQAAVMRWLLAGHEAVVLTPDEAELPAWARSRLAVIAAPRTSAASARQAWAEALGPSGYAGDVDELSAMLAQRFPLGAAAIRDVVRRSAIGDGDLAGLYREIRRYVPHTLGAYAERYETRMVWDDVVLAPETEETLRQILVHARERHVVFDGWGLGRLLPYGRGLGCLFSGPPGTGKTMMAGILANELGQELYRVDISRLVSKWLGETEKALARLFDEAERAGAILFFDEADSLFAKRTQVRGSNDRYANMEVNFLLQRMERFDGMSILATNLQQGMDPAFKRRLRFAVHFAHPDAAERTALWEKMLRGPLPLADDIDVGNLGRKFRLTGALIKNAVLRAAFFAADEKAPVDMAMLAKACQAEMMAQGRL